VTGLATREEAEKCHHSGHRCQNRDAKSLTEWAAGYGWWGALEFRAFGLKEKPFLTLCQFFDNRTCILLSNLHFIYSVVFDEMFDLQSLVRR
jgi:hypothetical protein